MKTILFINPCDRSSVLQNVKVLSLPPINLATLASCTPERYNVKLVDESVEPVDWDVEADLAAITSMTPLAPRAYEIAARFRKRGIPVILGGIHASMLTQEAEQYVDAVVVGEGEEIWPTVIEDFENGRLKKVYTTSLPDLDNSLAPRRDLLSKAYFVNTVQTSRGCPFNCDFCSVTRFNGGNYRFRPIDQVIAEIEQLKDKRFIFVDDNIMGSGSQATRRAQQLFDRLRELNKDWGSQICIDIIEHDQLLRSASKSNATFFFIGFESVETESLALLNKRINLRPTTRNFKDAIRKIHDHGIAVVGGFIFGGDGDTKDTFAKTVDFIHETGIDAAQFTVQTPFPGTRLYEKLQSEDRLLYTNYPEDWARYNGFDVVFRPKNMTAEELKAGQMWAYAAVASTMHSVWRAAKTLLRTKNITSTAVSFYWNYDCFKSIVRGA